MAPEEPSKEQAKEPVKTEQREAKIVNQLIEEEMERSYLDYAMSVIVGRALPDVRDGLKPVHRRILFAMNDMGMHHNKPFKKCARIVGEVLGKYHPHGDLAVYDSLVRMAQDFSLRYMLIDGQGNFGSIDGDSAAAMRYTECRLAKIAEEVLADIDKETVDFIPNFDGSLKEPVVLPSKIPNLLVNGSSGIAVGMATNIPPHNLKEIADGVVALIDNPEISIEQLMEIIKGPDFPTSGIILGTNGIRECYMTGRGKITLKARAAIENHKERERIIVTEIPYQVNKSMLVEEMAECVKDKRIVGISDIKDESNREGIRIVIDIKRDANSNLVLNQLFAYTRMTTTFGAIMLALVDNEPITLNLKRMLDEYLKHRKLMVRKRTEFDLRKAQEKAHILEGLIIALNHIDEVIRKIKASKTVEIARDVLMADYILSEMQAKAILDMKLQRLSSMEQEKIREEHKGLLALIEELKAILASEQRILEIIKDEMSEMKDKYGDERKTAIEFVEGEEAVIVEDLIKEENVVVTMSHAGYIKRTPAETYKSQNRGGRGVMAAGTREEDFIENLFIASTHSYILFFTNKGNVHWLKVYRIPEASRQAKGTAIVNLIQLEKDEKMAAFVQVRGFDDRHYLMLCTKDGTVKKTNLIEYSRPRQNGIIAITLEDGDNLVNAVLTDGDKQIIIATKNGLAIKFHESDSRPIGRTSKGVRGIMLKDKDEVIGMEIAREDKTLLTVTENGYGKRTMISEYRAISRGGVGVINIQCSERNGHVAAIKAVEEEDEIMMLSKKGIIIRCPAKDVSVISRNTQGVRLMKLEEGDKIVGAAKVIKE
ncbi:MAG: DNA gyrase subunit A [Candidatus Woesearchaeota archaeon]|nr:DNA gyrase subunit A [Candidatus Woesearchaeota archaeon]